MIAALILLLQAVAQTVPAPPPPAWPALPALEFQRPGGMGDLSRFVRDEAEAGRCAAVGVDAAGNNAVRVTVIVLVDAKGNVVTTTPAPMGCPTVEQYTAGVIDRLAAGNIRQPWPSAPAWFRTGLTYSWTSSSPRPR